MLHEGGLISEGIFNFDPNFKKCTKSMSFNFLTKLIDSDFMHIFGEKGQK